MANSGGIDLTRVKAILICAFGGYGDCLRVIPYVRATRERFSEATITILTETYGNEMFHRCPYVDEVISLPPTEPFCSRLDPLRNLARGLRAVRGRFNLFIGSPFRPRLAALLGLFSGASGRVGFKADRIYFAWTEDLGPVDYHRELEGRFDMLWQAIGIDQVHARLETWPSSEDESYTEEFLRMHDVHPRDMLIGIHPGSDWGCQQWDPRNWAALGNELQSRFGARLIVTGAKDEQACYDGLASLMPNAPINAVGKTTIGQLASLLSRFSALITVDSLLVPMGIAANIPVVVLDFRNRQAWMESRWPHVTPLHPPAWFSEPTVNDLCRNGKQSQRIHTCRLSVCVGTLGARLISVHDVLSAVEPLLRSQAVTQLNSGRGVLAPRSLII